MFSERQIARLLDIGNLACQKGLVAHARTIFDGVLALKPNFAPALVGLAFTHVVVDDFDGAQSILDKVLAANPEDSDALAVSGLSHMLAGRRDEAEQTFARIPQDSAAADMARAVMEMD
ncbi:MAG TPA: tetratricopeptide repeat protein [Candidatus Mailhella merdigallinarum]|uniref:Tetratricopeptide repeat protein n=1 Tax=Candidatus Mailhella merdigallinarum TaxID=2838658 RepID=A0A9D2HF30_9BACT|nr:tetratricopeptide repeat protein [Candidatus Mailhella merdigallinarum]